MRGVARLALLAAVAAAGAAKRPSSADLQKAARETLATMRPPLRARCVLPIEDEDRLEWRYTPGRRPGVVLKDMNETERRATHALLRAALSARGYEKAEGVIELEGILREVETLGGLWRDPELYYLTFFGEPSEARPWAFRFEGHHLSLNFSSATGRLVATTPAFYGANPARVPAGRPRAGWRLLSAEEDLARILLASLDARQRKAAVIAVSAPSDIVLAPGRARAPELAGLAASQMTEPQRQILMSLIGEYLGNMREEAAEFERARIEEAGAGAIRFAWAGATEPGHGHYYRVQGPTFVIEYDNTQNDANHVHSVWRDPGNDFGGDLLRRHYAESPHHRDARPASSGRGSSPPAG